MNTFARYLFCSSVVVTEIARQVQPSAQQQQQQAPNYQPGAAAAAWADLVRYSPSPATGKQQV